MTDPLARWGLTPVINASGTMTDLGASRVSPEVRAVVDAILARFVMIDELQDRASEVIAQATGAEAGTIVGSSAAGIAQVIAALLAGEDIARVEALPASGPERPRVIVQAGHLINYGAPVAQAVWMTGAEVDAIGTAARCELAHMRLALADGAAAVLHIVSHHTVREGELPLDLVIAEARAAGVPVIVDMASEYDLTGPIAGGAAAAIYSAHKFLGGPTAGIVAGNAALIRAVRAQNAGLGRKMKVGKEGIAGAMAALDAWARRDHAAEAAREDGIVAGWEAALAGLTGVAIARHRDWTGNPITRLELRLTPEAPCFAWELAARLKSCDPSIHLRDDLAEHGLLYLDPCNVTEEEAQTVSEAIRATLDAFARDGTGRKRSWSDVKAGRDAS